MSQPEPKLLNLSSFSLKDVETYHREIHRLIVSVQAQSEGRNIEHYAQLAQFHEHFKVHSMNLYRRYFQQWLDTQEIKQLPDSEVQASMNTDGDRCTKDADKLEAEIAKMVDTKRVRRIDDVQANVSNKRRKTEILVHPLAYAKEENERDSKLVCAVCKNGSNKTRYRCIQCTGCPPLHIGLCNVKYHNPHHEETHFCHFDIGKKPKRTTNNKGSKLAVSLEVEQQWKSPNSQKEKPAARK